MKARWKSFAAGFGLLLIVVLAITPSANSAPGVQWQYGRLMITRDGSVWSDGTVTTVGANHFELYRNLGGTEELRSGAYAMQREKETPLQILNYLGASGWEVVRSNDEWSDFLPRRSK